MLSRKEQDAMVAAVQKSVEQTVETHQGYCTAVDDATGEEYAHKWRGGEARVYVENDADDTGHEYVLAVRVVLVAVVPE